MTSPARPSAVAAPDAWTAEALVTAWRDVFLGIEAHIRDRMAMDDPASPETYLSIIRGDIADLPKRSEQIVNARWADSKRAREETDRLTSRVEKLEKALAKAAEQFESYAEQHRAKGTPEGRVKAATNDHIAEMCRALLPKGGRGKEE